MRKLILQEFLTLDGLAAGPHDSVDYVPQTTKGDKGFGSEQLELFDSIDTILLGRATYQMFAGHWPNVTDPEEKVFADKINGTPKIVFSKTLARAPWGEWPAATIVKGAAASEIRALKQQPGKNMIVWGSISLAQSLIREGLIDEYRLVYCPVALGEGRPLFRDDAAPRSITLAEVKAFERGAAMVRYVAR